MLFDGFYSMSELITPPKSDLVLLKHKGMYKWIKIPVTITWWNISHSSQQLERNSCYKLTT